MSSLALGPTQANVKISKLKGSQEENIRGRRYLRTYRCMKVWRDLCKSLRILVLTLYKEGSTSSLDRYNDKGYTDII